MHTPSINIPRLFHQILRHNKQSSLFNSIETIHINYNPDAFNHKQMPNNKFVLNFQAVQTMIETTDSISVFWLSHSSFDVIQFGNWIVEFVKNQSTLGRYSEFFTFFIARDWTLVKKFPLFIFRQFNNFFLFLDKDFSQPTKNFSFFLFYVHHQNKHETELIFAFCMLCTRDGWRRRKIVAARERKREHKRVCERKKRKAFTALQLGKPFDAGFFIIYAFSDLYSDLFPFNRDFSILDSYFHDYRNLFSSPPRKWKRRKSDVWEEEAFLLWLRDSQFTLMSAWFFSSHFYSTALITFTPMTLNGLRVYLRTCNRKCIWDMAEGSQDMVELKSRQYDYLVRLLGVFWWRMEIIRCFGVKALWNLKEFSKEWDFWDTGCPFENPCLLSSTHIYDQVS